jgi:hypothetical protein
MKLFKPTPVFVLTGLLCNAALCSEEPEVPTYKMSIWADGGKRFGKVNATLETTDSQKNLRIKSIVLTIKGKKFIVPQASFKNLQRPRINTAQFLLGHGGFRRDGKSSGSPYLYLMFRLWNLKAKSDSDHPKVYIRFRDGKLQTTHVISDGQFVYNDKYRW